jgi:hypothetical protein
MRLPRLAPLCCRSRILVQGHSVLDKLCFQCTVVMNVGGQDDEVRSRLLDLSDEVMALSKFKMKKDGKLNRELEDAAAIIREQSACTCSNKTGAVDACRAQPCCVKCV